MRIRDEFQRLRKDNRLVIGLALSVLIVWSAVSVLEQRAPEMEPATMTRGFTLEPRWEAELAGVEFAVEEIPPAEPASDDPEPVH